MMTTRIDIAKIQPADLNAMLSIESYLLQSPKTKKTPDNQESSIFTTF